MSSDLRHSPLHDRHVALNAKFAPFGGWDMPLEYVGVLREHAAVRESVGVFDVSHLGRLRVQGLGAVDFVNRCLTNDLGKIGPGRAQYTLCCSDDGGVIDDLIAYIESPDSVLLIPNAANVDAVAALLIDAAPAGIVVEPVELAIIAVQGPQSSAVLAELGLPHDFGYMSFAVDDGVIVCRTGYTGEHGYELLVPYPRAGKVWDGVVAAGAQPAGLGARDTLRTEMGYPLHGQDLSLDISPLQARAGWAVALGGKTPGKDEFWGREALAAEKAAGPRRLLRGVLLDERAVPRPGMTVRSVAGETVGTVTSGTFSPTLKQGIALALIDTASGLSDGDPVTLDVRGRTAAAHLIKPPFVDVHP